MSTSVVPTPSIAAFPLAELRRTLTGTVAEPDEAGYALATPWNVAVPCRPRAVVAVADVQDVSRTVRFAARHGLRIAVRRTGHGAVPVEGDDVLLLHTGRLDGCTVDAGAGVATVGAGCVWQDVLDAAAPHGRLPLVGSAPAVGVVGFLTGGGIGPMARTFGPSSDHVRAFEVVTGQGDVLRATPDQHADLFWGLRGGKGTLGIVTAVEIDLPAPEAVHGGALWFDGADAPAVLRAWRDWCRDLPEHASTSIALMQLPPLPGVPEPLAGRLTVSVRYVSVADGATAEQLLAPVRAAATPLVDTVGPLPTTGLGSVHADPVDPVPSHEGSALLDALPDDALDALLAVAGPGSGSVQAMVELRLLGGAVARPRHPGALCHRDAAFNLMCVGVLAPPVAELVAPHTASILGAMAPWSTGGLLPNFAASADAATIARCYDADARHWLAGLAEQYDPSGVLRIGQVVRADGPAAR